MWPSERDGGILREGAVPVTGSVRIEYTGHGEQEERSCLKESLGKEHEKAGRNGQELLTISDKGCVEISAGHTLGPP